MRPVPTLLAGPSAPPFQQILLRRKRREGVDAPRRVECAEHGVVVEHIPWSDGKRPVTCAMMGFLARWARRLSWRETARAFQTSWEAVYRSVEWFVQWGLAHRELLGVESLGVDEIH